MTFRFFKDKDEKHYQKARTRLKRLTPHVVLQWADSGIWAVQEGVEGFRNHTDRAALEQARTGIIGVLAAVDDLLDKSG